LFDTDVKRINLSIVMSLRGVTVKWGVLGPVIETKLARAILALCG
jgi:hypothetical protein